MDIVNEKVQSEINKIKNPVEKQIANKLRTSLNNNIANETDGRLLPSERAVIFSDGIAYMSDYRVAYKDKTPSDVLKLVDTNQNKIIHQHIQDKNYLT
jgi:hypothetical protein